MKPRRCKRVRVIPRPEPRHWPRCEPERQRVEHGETGDTGRISKSREAWPGSCKSSPRDPSEGGRVGRAERLGQAAAAAVRGFRARGGPGPASESFKGWPFRGPGLYHCRALIVSPMPGCQLVEPEVGSGSVCCGVTAGRGMREGPAPEIEMNHGDEMAGGRGVPVVYEC